MSKDMPAKFVLDAKGKKTPVAMAAEGGGGDDEWQCKGCKDMYGPSADAYCTKCAADDDDDGDEPDGDEDEAKAIGLAPKATLGARRARIAALVDFESKVLAAVGGDGLTHTAATLLVIEGANARAEIVKVRTEGQKASLRAVLERGLAGVPGKQPTLSLGQVQKGMTVALRGESKKAWSAAMNKLAADADTAKTTITAAQILDAACSVQLSADDLESIQDYVRESPPVAAATVREPPRNGETESAELAQLDPKVAAVAKAAKFARSALDKNKPAAK